MARSKTPIISLVETDPLERWSIVKRSDRSQILFRYRRRWKTLTGPGYVPTAASLLLAQPFLLLLWLAMGAFPAWAQTGASLSGVVTDPTGAALPDAAVTIKNVVTGATRTVATDEAQTHAFLEQIDSMRTTCENIRLLQRELWNLSKPAGNETIPASVGLRTAFHTVEELIKMEKQFKSLSRSMIEPLMSKENFEALFPHLVEDGKK